LYWANSENQKKVLNDADVGLKGNTNKNNGLLQQTNDEE